MDGGSVLEAVYGGGGSRGRGVLSSLLLEVERHSGRSGLSKAALDLTKVVVAALIHELGSQSLEPLALGEGNLRFLELAHVAAVVLE